MWNLFLFFYDADLSGAFQNDLFYVFEAALVCTLANAFVQVFDAHAGPAHIIPIQFPICVERGCLSFYPAAHAVIIQAHPCQEPVYQYKGETGHCGGYKGGGAYDDAAESEFQSFPGVIMKCRIIGGIKAEQSKAKNSDKLIRNDRFLAVPKCSNIFQDVEKMEDLPGQITDQLEAFFGEYNKLEGKKFKALGKMGPKEAQKLIEDQLG